MKLKTFQEKRFGINMIIYSKSNLSSQTYFLKLFELLIFTSNNNLCCASIITNTRATLSFLHFRIQQGFHLLRLVFLLFLFLFFLSLPYS